MDEETILATTEDSISYIVFNINSNTELEIDLDFIEGAEEIFAQLLFGINAGLLTEPMCTKLKEVCSTTNREKQGSIIIDQINQMIKNRILEMGPKFVESYNQYVKVASEDAPVVDPCNVFRTQTGGEVK